MVFPVAAGIFAIHLALLFLPPIPPFYKRSLWSFLLAYGTLVLLLCDRRVWVTRLADWWVSLESRARAPRVLAILDAIGGLGVALRATAPEVFARFSREGGLWEPIGLLAFLASALVLGLHETRTSDGGVRRHLRLLAAGSTLLALEEVDYLGIFDRMNGRIQGTHAGALHDVIRL